jgi:hypothetical protein
LEHDVGDDTVAQHYQNSGAEDLGQDRRHEDWVKGSVARFSPMRLVRIRKVLYGCNVC